MKKTLSFLLITLPILFFSQKIIGETELSNGKKIKIKDDYTWEYVGSLTEGASSYLYNDVSTTKKDRVTGSYNKANITQKKKQSYRSNYSSSNYCGASTKSGGSCRRKVKGGGRCWQH